MLDITITTDDAITTVLLTGEDGRAALYAWLVDWARGDSFLLANGACRLSVDDDGAVYTHDMPETVRAPQAIEPMAWWDHCETPGHPFGPDVERGAA